MKGLHSFPACWGTTGTAGCSWWGWAHRGVVRAVRRPLWKSRQTWRHHTWGGGYPGERWTQLWFTWEEESTGWGVGKERKESKLCVLPFRLITKLCHLQRWGEQKGGFLPLIWVLVNSDFCCCVKYEMSTWKDHMEGPSWNWEKSINWCKFLYLNVQTNNHLFII